MEPVFKQNMDATEELYNLTSRTKEIQLVIVKRVLPAKIETHESFVLEVVGNCETPQTDPNIAAESTPFPVLHILMPFDISLEVNHIYSIENLKSNWRGLGRLMKFLYAPAFFAKTSEQAADKLIEVNNKIIEVLCKRALTSSNFASSTRAQDTALLDLLNYSLCGKIAAFPLNTDTNGCALSLDPLVKDYKTYAACKKVHEANFIIFF